MITQDGEGKIFMWSPVPIHMGEALRVHSPDKGEHPSC